MFRTVIMHIVWITCNLFFLLFLFCMWKSNTYQMVDWCIIRRRRSRVCACPSDGTTNNCPPFALLGYTTRHIPPLPSLPPSFTTPRTIIAEDDMATMSEQDQEEFRVLFAAAEKGRADIINTVVEALKKSGLSSAEEGLYLLYFPYRGCD